MYMFAPVWMKSTMCEWKSVSPDCKMGVCQTNTDTIVPRLRLWRTKKDRLQSRLSNNDEKETVRRLRCISLQKRQPFHRPPAPRPARHPAKRCKKDSSAQHSAATRNCNSPGGRRFFGTGKCWCGPGRMVPAATALFSFSPSFAGRGRARAPMRPPPGGPHHLPLPIGAVP